MLSNAVQYKAMLKNTYAILDLILIEWWALLCTQRPNCSRVCLVSKKFLSIIYHLSYIIPPTLVLGAASLQLALKKRILVNIWKSFIVMIKENTYVIFLVMMASSFNIWERTGWSCSVELMTRNIIFQKYQNRKFIFRYCFLCCPYF